MNSSAIRQKFLDFFAAKQHHIVPSAPIVVKDDPTLMFTNAGMNQFKDYFLGNQPAPWPRVADTQKCLRVSGKHNDLEEVGYDTYHHTLFEMLGNWSFGDYFKKDALHWAWELLTEVYNLPKDRLYVSVFGGDEQDNLPADTEAFTIWKNILGGEDRILFGAKKDNFWEMGDTGPCGPCSEIHIDLRPNEEVAQQPGKELVNNDHPQVVEIWNNVFMEFNRLADGSLVQLPAKHVDTGMGFERLCMAVQGKRSNYDTDVFQPLIQFVAGQAGVTYGENEKTDIAIRVLADHIRAIAFAIADGQLPANNKAGYVIRRILRRAVRYAFTFLNFKKPFLYQMVPVLADQLLGIFPELKAQQAFVQRVIEEEELAFLRTLENGLKRLDALRETFQANQNKIDGKTAFELYDTFGFPADLTALIAKENNFTVDEAGFEAEMQAQKTRSRNAAQTEQGDWVLVGEDVPTEFIGYDAVSTEARLVKYRPVTAKNKTEYQLVLDRTPFYAESGGQVGDSGFLESDLSLVKVLDTKKENDLIIHITHELPNDLTAPVLARIDTERRGLIQKNHSATHLLHAALREVLGPHVAQKGSLVSEKLLRFDFSHFTKVTDDQLRDVEAIVNQNIRRNIPLDEKRNVPIAAAKQLGATALFGEKYGEFVRVITFDKDYSVELCGGTHVPQTGEIGLFKLVAESSVAAGVRRLEAYTADQAQDYIHEQLQQLAAVKEVLGTPQNPAAALEKLVAENAALKKQLEQFEIKQLHALKDTLVQNAREVAGVKLIAERVTVPSADSLKKLAFDVRHAMPENLCLVLAAEIDGKPQLAVMLSDNLVAQKLNAVSLVKELAKEIKGGGGGQPFYATAGGKEVAGLSHIPAKAAELLTAQLRS